MWDFILPPLEVLEFEPSLKSIAPPLLAIIMALFTRQIIFSLFIGIWIGSTLVLGNNPIDGLLYTIDTRIINTIINNDQARILIFTIGFGGVIGVVSANGGMKGFVKTASKYARTKKNGQLATMLTGIFIFFDDYANTLFVGNMMRPFTDKLKVSREKLAYIVDSTAAPVASLAIISTWSVFQMSLLEAPYKSFGITQNPYVTFINSIPYSFYCIFTLFFMAYLIVSGREYSYMLAAEKRIIEKGKVSSKGVEPLSKKEKNKAKELLAKSSHWSNAILPIGFLIIITLIGLYTSGIDNLSKENHSIRAIIGASDPYKALIWGSLLAGFFTIILSSVMNVLTFKESIEAWVEGAKSMLMACMILVLAWTMGDICSEVKTADYIISLTNGILTPNLLPIVTFVTAAIVSFCTGSSWGTMPILVPIAVPLAFNLLGGEDPNAILSHPVYLATFASILSGCVFGDHCSPLSDTTILSSIASGSDHIDHVRTQLPYAVTTGIISLFLGYALVGFIPVFLLIIFGAIAVIFIVNKLGAKP